MRGICKVCNEKVKLVYLNGNPKNPMVVGPHHGPIIASHVALKPRLDNCKGSYQESKNEAARE